MSWMSRRELGIGLSLLVTKHVLLMFLCAILLTASRLANAYPSVNVLGIDISRMQPERFALLSFKISNLTRSAQSIPSNCHFDIKDAEDEWNFATPFDYIHGRALASCFHSHKTVFEHAFKALRPGGYFELQDCLLPLRFFDSTGKGTALETWAQRLNSGAAALGKDFGSVVKYKAILEEIGFIEIVELQFQLPIGTWAAGKKMKTLGELMRKDLLHGIEGMSMAVQTRGLGLNPDEVKLHLAEVKKDLLNDKVHAYFQM
jgi:SAM-dependent methyltransferase